MLQLARRFPDRKIDWNFGQLSKTGQLDINKSSSRLHPLSMYERTIEQAV
jgi:hypothetical protein